MKVLDLACSSAHVFEGWFASEADFLVQRERGLIECPLCGCTQIVKQLSAPRLNLGHGRKPFEPDATDQAPASGTGVAPTTTRAPQAGEIATAQPKQQQAALLRVLREVLTQTEDVGTQFAEQARQMHEGELKPRAIRGQTTPAQAAKLLQDRVPIVPIPDWALHKPTLQ